MRIPFDRSAFKWSMIIALVGICAVFFIISSLPSAHALVANGALVKTDESSAVYYVYNNQRYAFPNEKTFFTWYADFSSVITISASELASYQLVKNVTYRPNDRLLKITTDPKVYAITRCGTLHWVSTESLAIQLWGSQWGRLIDDLPDSFFSSYTVGNAYSQITDYLVDPTIYTIADNNTNCSSMGVVTIPQNPFATPVTSSTSPAVASPPASPSLPATVTVTLNQQQVTNGSASKLFGTNFDGRASIDLPTSKHKGGYYDYKTAAVFPEIAPLWDPIKFKSFRYPGSPANAFDWKGTVKPKYAVNFTGNVRTLAFGFDEFMDMTSSKGISPSDIHITLNIHSVPTAPDPLQNALDWVEYANAPNDGSNPGGGTDWAAVRAANGHPNPWGIKLWNIGLEPWSDKEYKMDPVPYLAVAVPMVDALLQIDPTLKILIPAAGTASQSATKRAQMTAWDTAIINSPQLKGKIYGLTPHYYYEDNLNGTLARSVAAIEGALDVLIQQIGTANLKIVVGEHAHSITLMNGVPVGDPNLAMQWDGVIVNTDFLMMLSQKSHIDRAQFFTYGVPSNTWHPIRENTDGSFTLMPVAGVHQLLGDLFYDRALSVSISSPQASDGNAYAVRAGVFASPVGSNMSAIIVNRDPSVDHVVSIQGTTGKTLKRARLLTATSHTSETFQTTDLLVSSLGSTISLPHFSVLLLEYI